MKRTTRKRVLVGVLAFAFLAACLVADLELTSSSSSAPPSQGPTTFAPSKSLQTSSNGPTHRKPRRSRAPITIVLSGVVQPPQQPIVVRTPGPTETVTRVRQSTAPAPPRKTVTRTRTRTAHPPRPSSSGVCIPGVVCIKLP